MTEYCEVCGEELDPEEEFEGICKNCKKSQQREEKDEEEYIDPGITQNKKIILIQILFVYYPNLA